MHSIHTMTRLRWLLQEVSPQRRCSQAAEMQLVGSVSSRHLGQASCQCTGGQAFVMKLRKTSERSPTSMILEPPHTLNGSDADPDGPLRWRHMK